MIFWPSISIAFHNGPLEWHLMLQIEGQKCVGPFFFTCERQFCFVVVLFPFNPSMRRALVKKDFT
jgi:hypothetical protein